MQLYIQMHIQLHNIVIKKMYNCITQFAVVYIQITINHSNIQNTFNQSNYGENLWALKFYIEKHILF